MTTWWATPISQQETCWNTSSRLTITSLWSTSISISNTCVGLGFPNSQLSPCSSKLSIVPIILKQGAVSLPPPPTNQRRIGQGIHNCSLHECMSTVERKTCHKKTWTHFKSHFAAAHRSLSAQANAGRICSHSRFLLSKFLRCPQ
jgi:hypothetical protein